MADNLLESYNPLYDVHLRQYFALPHMQKHLRNLGLLDVGPAQDKELHAGHLQMMDMMLRNRERVLAQLMDLQRKLDAAEKVELYRRIRSGATNADELDRSHVSRSLSRPARSAARSGRGRRRQSLSPEAGEMIKRVETDYRSDSAPFKNPKSIYNRLAANVYKYQYLHKLDDRTLHKYMNSLRKQLAKLERFREVSFGPHTMARHQPSQFQQSWFFRRRSLPSLDAAGANHNHHPTQPQPNAGRRSLKSGLSRKSRSGKSQSPLRVSALEEPPNKMQRTSVSRTRGTQRLPPLPQSAPNKKSSRTSAAQRTTPTPGKGSGGGEPRLPPTAVIRPTRKVQEPPQRRPAPVAATGKKTPVGSRPASQKGSTTPVAVQKPPSAGNGVLPAIGSALAGATVGAGIAAAAATMAAGEKEEENRGSGAPSPSISLAASQTTTTDGGQPGGDSEWEGEQNAGSGVNGGTETRPTPEPFLETKTGEGKEEIGMMEHAEEMAEGEQTAQPSIHSQVQSPEEEQPPDEPEPQRMGVEEENGVESNVGQDEEEVNMEEKEKQEDEEREEDGGEQQVEEEPKHEGGNEEPEDPMVGRMHFEEGTPAADETYPDEIHSLEKETPEIVPEIGAEYELEGVGQEEMGEEAEGGVELHSDRSKREVTFVEEDMANRDDGLHYGKQEWVEANEEGEDGEEEVADSGELREEYGDESGGGGSLGGAPSLDATESERIRQFSHPNVDQETGPEESVRSLASSSVEGSLQKEEERPKSGEEHFKEESNIEEQREAEPAVEVGKEDDEVPKVEEREDEPDAGFVQTPVQIEITPSPENRNWDEEEDFARGQKEEEDVEGRQNIDEEVDLERDINGNDMMGMGHDEGREKDEAEEGGVAEKENDEEEPPRQQSTPEFYNEISGPIEAGSQPESNDVEEGNEEGAEEVPKEVEWQEKEHIPVEFANQRDDGELEAELVEAHGEEERENDEQPTGGQDEEMLETTPRENEEEGRGEERFDRVKRENDEHSVDLVESESVKAEEEGLGRKLSGTDALLEEGTEMESGGNEQGEEAEIGEGNGEELVENAVPFEEQEPKGESPVAMNGMDPVENREVVEELAQANSPMAEEQSKSSDEAVEEDKHPEEDEQNPPNEDPIGQGGMPSTQEESANYFGKPCWTPMEAESEEKEGTNEEAGMEKQSEFGEVAIENTQFGGEEEEDKQITPKYTPREEVHMEEEMGIEGPIIVSHSPSKQEQEVGDRPATAEAVPQGNSLLSQPSIEITPASEYGGSVEDNRDIISITSPQPTSPVSRGENEEEMAKGNAENKAEEEDRHIAHEIMFAKQDHEGSDAQLIDLGSSSPVAEEFGQAEEMGEADQQHPHQNGHKEKEENEEEEEEEGRKQNGEVDERTPLFSSDGEGGHGIMGIGQGGGKGNGHLLSGHGGGGSSSSETEGADEEGSEGEGSVVIHGGSGNALEGIGHHHQQQQHFQSVKLEDDDLEKEEA